MQSILTLTEAIVEQKIATQLYLLQGYQRENPKDERGDAFDEMSKHRRRECWDQLGYFPGIYCVW
jgi:hypothetical protein